MITRHWLCLWGTLLAAKTSAFVVVRPHGIHKTTGKLMSPSVRPMIPRLERMQQTAARMKMVSYEQLMEKTPSKAVVAAVEAASDGKVVASDLAAAAGVSISQAKKDLTALASLTRGDIQVSSDGELIYIFPKDVKGALAANSAKYKAMQLFEKAWPAVFWLVRVSFGVALLASLLAVFSTIFFITSGSSSSDDDRRDSRGGGGFGGSFGYFWGPSPFDFFYYRPYGYYGYYGYGQPMRDPEEMGFLESVFSYVFGDGNPNQGLEEKRLSLVAQMIRENQGAVTAEQIAPYCDDAPAPGDGASTYVDESFVLPIVTQLNGEPRVTDDGDIVYVFPDLQMSATSKKILPAVATEAMTLRRAGIDPDASAAEIKQILRFNGISTRGVLEKRDLVRLLEEALPPLTQDEEAELADADPSVLQERPYKFSLASDLNKFLAGGLGVVNLGGALYLGNLLAQYAAYGIQLPSYFGLVQAAYPLLLVYAVLFNAIPLARNFWNGSQNDKIQRRNEVRRLWKSVVSSKNFGNLSRKLKAASKMRMQMKKLGGDDILYDTRATIEDMEKKRQKDALDSFDKLLDKDK